MGDLIGWSNSNPVLTGCVGLLALIVAAVKIKAVLWPVLNRWEIYQYQWLAERRGFGAQFKSEMTEIVKMFPSEGHLAAPQVFLRLRQEHRDRQTER